ncbi:MAG: cryptochrome/photolyase family protein [Mycobacteriaceae bacterium]
MTVTREVHAGTSIVWFRRDLRTHDLPVLDDAYRSDGTLGVFILDPMLLASSGLARRAFLYNSLRALNESLDGKLLLVSGDPVLLIPLLAKQISADAVHISEDFGPYGRMRDASVAQQVRLRATGSPYTVAPGRLRKEDGAGYRVFTPYFRRWLEHGWRLPAQTNARTVGWLDPDGLVGLPPRLVIPSIDTGQLPLPEAGEKAAISRWKEFLHNDINNYGFARDRPDLDATSKISVYLKWGAIHPRTMLKDMKNLDKNRDNAGIKAFERELAFRDFYADILFHKPHSARQNFNSKFDSITYNTGHEAEQAFASWCAGTTGFPIVDAGMRQLKQTGWMHNRVRMIVASFLVKDLHLPWWIGARYFMQQLIDGDLPSNQHGWQWTAGTGTDAAPYFRVFNPLLQGHKFDPSGDYVRRWVPELRAIPGSKVHDLGNNRPRDYPLPIVDHKQERLVALERYTQISR